MESKLKAECMDQAGELPNLLLREDNYPHLPHPCFVPEPKKEPELTDWISGDLKPVRPGVYQRHFESGVIGYSCFYRGKFRQKKLKKYNVGHCTKGSRGAV